MILDLEETFTVGQDIYFNSISPTSLFGVAFEDDLTTGYFYAINYESDVNILDALHIYNVSDITDKEKLSCIQIFWTNDGLIASLLINNYCHAIFNFKQRRGYCRNAFPESSGKWMLRTDRTLTDNVINTIFIEHP